MSTEIYWSKAPEWATVRLRNKSCNKYFAWAESYKEGSRFTRDDLDREFRSLMVDSWDLIGVRHAAWNGQGLPPVGVACEYMRGGLPHISQDWEKVIPLAFGSKLAFLRYAATGNEFTEKVYRCDFRPIRTQAQIASEERREAISEMVELTRGAHHWREAFTMLHDAGYRKQPTKQDGE
jgi:hypothetical protein